MSDLCVRRIRRDRPDILQNSILVDTFFDPPFITKQLQFGVERKKHKIDCLIRTINTGFSNDDKVNIENCTKVLGIMITEDPRLCQFLENDFLTLLIRLLNCERNSNILRHVVTIFTTVVTLVQDREDIVEIIDEIFPIVLKLIHFGVYMVQVEALWLLRNIVFAIPKCRVERVEEVVAIVTPLIITESNNSFNVLHGASDTLLVACEVHQNLSREKLKLVVPALMKLIESNILVLLTSGCSGLAFLCDGRREMIIEDIYIRRLITRLVNVMHSTERVMVLTSLHAMGSIVRWGSDDIIEFIIQEDGALLILLILLDEYDMYLVKQTCWILSSITARKEQHIRAVIDGVSHGKLIDSLVKVVQNCKLDDVRNEAVGAISNAMCGVGIDQIECLRISCSKISWSTVLQSYIGYTDKQLLFGTLEGLVNIKLAIASILGRPIGVRELNSILDKMPDRYLFHKSEGCDVFFLMIPHMSVELHLECVSLSQVGKIINVENGWIL